MLAGTTCVALAFLATPALATEWHCTLAKERCPFQLVPTKEGKEGKEEQLQEFTDEGLIVKCTKLRETRGELQKKSLSLQYKPTFSGCKTSKIGGVEHAATVTNTGCEIRLIIQTQKEEKPKKAQGRVEIKCTTGNSILVKVAGTTCEIKVPGQGSSKERTLKKFRAEQLEVRKGEREVHIIGEVEGMHAVNSAGCGIAAETKTAEYKGRAKIESKYGIKLR